MDKLKEILMIIAITLWIACCWIFQDYFPFNWGSQFWGM